MLKQRAFAVVLILTLLAFAADPPASTEPTLSCNASSTLSKTTFLIGKTNVTYLACVPSGANTLVICDGFVTSRINTTAAKTTTVTNKRSTAKDFANCMVYDRDNEKAINEVNTTTSAIK